ncbi:tumor protein D54-like isoform X3 [Xyrauchen texanus]|uniref:tumor protein D54-like isoform X3 n=2 Tax=Xyrauchen texanus TaxID=154827 RepID=UPI00224199C8|nr:tumor protein D54-like isoform X3 [Xyrauchen texanus]
MDSSEHGIDSTMTSTDVASGGTLPPGLTLEEAEELQLELTKVDDEIQTLRQVLTAKERHAAELKRRLGLSPLTEIKQNFTKGWHEVQCSNAYKRTQETLSQAGQMTSTVFSTMGSAIRNRLGEMRALPYSNSGSNLSMHHSLSMPAMRSSPSFKSFEDKVENMKYKVMGRSNGEGDHSPQHGNNTPF